MKICDSRYARELERLQLAGRMLVLGARTRTVAECTALSFQRIRQLYRECVSGNRESPRRGETPRQVGAFWRSGAVACNAALLGGLLRHFGVELLDLHLRLSTRMERAAGLCCAMEVVAALGIGNVFRFEQGRLLQLEIALGVEASLAKCSRCASLMLRDGLRLQDPVCPLCRDPRPTPQQALHRLMESL